MRRGILAIATVLLAGVLLESIARLGFGWQPLRFHRPYEPFFASGDLASGTRDQVAQGHEGPASYGYAAAGVTFLHDSTTRPYATDRSDFLFQHYLSRYTPDEVNAITCGQPNAARLFVVGGSVAQGSSASHKETSWHARLERLLRTALDREDLYVFNAAMGAFVSAQERIALELAVMPRAPSAVVILDGYNDLVMPAAYGIRAGDPYETGRRYQDLYGGGLWRLLIDHSALVATLSVRRLEQRLKRSQALVASDPAARQTYENDVRRVYEDHVTAMLARCADARIPCWVALQPFRAYASTGREADVLPNALLTAIYQHLVAGLRSGSFGSQVVDLSSLFVNQPSVWTDAVHVNDDGQDRIARALGSVVAPALRTIGPSRRPQLAQCATFPPRQEIPPRSRETK